MPSGVNRYWTLLAKYLRPQLPKVMLMGALLFGSIALQLINPQIVRIFLDEVQAGGALESLTRVAALFIVVAIVQQVVSVAATYVSNDVGWTATNRLRADLTRHCLQLDMSFHKSRTPGELIERVDGDVTALANFFSQLVVRVLGNGLLALGILVLLWREDWRVGLVGVSYALLVIIFFRAIQKPAVKLYAAERQSEAELFGFLGERLNGTEDIRANGGEPYVMRRLYQLMREYTQKGLRAALIGTITFTVAFSGNVLAYIATLAIGATLLLQGAMSIGTVFVLVYYINLIEAPLNIIRRQLADLQTAIAGIERIAELLDMRSSIAVNAKKQIALKPAAVMFDRVLFRYEDGGQNNGVVIEDVSFDLPAGRVLGLLGRTGSGKTTITRLLFRLYDPAVGAIRIGDVDVRDVSLSNLRQRVGMVTQDVQLFAASVRDNLTFFNRSIDDARILDALDELGLLSWYRTLPNGLDTQLDAGGSSLSAGEAQLLAFARVFLKDPALVILDEASSRLDPATEQLLERAIDRLLHNRTGIVIAHRLKTVQRVDDILILERGRVREYGERIALTADPHSRFYSLLQTGLEEALA